MNTRRNVWLWTLYDFANSMVSIVFFLYLSQWLVIDQKIPDLWFNLTFTITAIALLFTVPITGALLDKRWRRITGIRITTLVAVLFYGACAIAAVNNLPIVALVVFAIGSYSYLLSFTFYTPLLNDIAPPEKRGWVSGLGIAANYSGQIVGLLVVLPFSNGTLNFFGGMPRAETLLPAVVLFCLLSLPMLIFFREPRRGSDITPLNKVAKYVWSDTKELFLFPGIALFMLSYFFFNDAVLTAANNFPIFLQQVWGVSDTIKTYIMVAILLTSAIGGALSGLVADRFGHKRTLIWILAGWIVILPALGLLTHFALFVTLVTLMGFWFGANWTVSRSMMSDIAPPQKHNLAFAYYGLVERASAFVGPVVWGLIVSNLEHLGALRYRIAVASIAVFVVVGVIALHKVRVHGFQKKSIPSSL